MNTDYRKLMLRFRRDPVFFCRTVLGVEPWSKQVEVLESLRDRERVAVRSGHGTGKSFIAASAALWFLYSHYPAKVITTAPTWNQVRAILWQEIRSQYSRAKIPLGGKILEEGLKLSPGSFAVGLSTDEPERFQGYHAEQILVILDEAPGVREEVWEASETLLTGRMSRLLAIGNPTRATGPFYRAFDDAAEWHRIQISCEDSPNLSGDSSRYGALVTSNWIERKRREWGESSALFQSRVLGNFPEDSDGVLIPRSVIEDAAKREAISKVCGSLRLGVDVARFGNDRTVFVIRDDKAIRLMEVRQNWDTCRTAAHVRLLAETWNITESDIFIDDTGVGAGVTDRLHESGIDVQAVIMAASSSSKIFSNLRAECFWRLRRAVCEEDFSLSNLTDTGDENNLCEELQALRYELTPSGAIRMEGKTSLRSALGRSPDIADALALTFATVEKDSQPVFSII